MKTILSFLFSFFLTTNVFAGVDSFEFNCKNYEGNEIISGKFDVNEVMLKKGVLQENFSYKTEEARVKFRDIKGVRGKYKNNSDLVGTPISGFDSDQGHPLTVWPYSFSDADADFWEGTELRFEYFYTNVELWEKDETGQFQKTEAIQVLLPSEPNQHKILHAKLSEFFDGGLEDSPIELLCKVKRVVD